MKIDLEQYLKRIKNSIPKKDFSVSPAVDNYGLDVGTYSIKIAHVNKLKDRVKLVGCGECIIKNGDILKAIRQAFDLTGIKTNTVNIGLAGQGVIIRHASLPKMQLKDLKQSISTEADKYIPFPITDVMLDCYILQESIQGNKMLVLIAAAKKEIIQERLKLLFDLKMEPKVIDINSVAVVNCFNELQPKENPPANKDAAIKLEAVALLHIGASLSCLNILENSLLKLSRDIYIGGNDFSKRIGYKLNVDFEKAEQFKIGASEDQASKHLEACDLILNNLVHELRISFDYYETENNIAVKKLYLTGGSAYLKEIDSFISKNVGVEVEIWEPCKYLELDPTVDIARIKSRSSNFTNAIGLALR